MFHVVNSVTHQGVVTFANGAIYCTSLFYSLLERSLRTTLPRCHGTRVAINSDTYWWTTYAFENFLTVYHWEEHSRTMLCMHYTFSSTASALHSRRKKAYTLKTKGCTKFYAHSIADLRLWSGVFQSFPAVRRSRIRRFQPAMIDETTTSHPSPRRDGKHSNPWKSTVTAHFCYVAWYFRWRICHGVKKPVRAYW